MEDKEAQWGRIMEDKDAQWGRIRYMRGTHGEGTPTQGARERGDKEFCMLVLALDALATRRAHAGTHSIVLGVVPFHQ